MVTQPATAPTGTGTARLGGSPDQRSGSVPVALLRITLGVILIVTWYDNLTGDLYTADGLEGFLNWLFTSPEEGGNGSSLGFYESFLDSVIAPVAGPYATFQLIFELVMGIALLLGVLTRFFSLAAIAFFGSLFLGYFGGEEWIWTYVLLIMAAVTVYLGFGGRTWGVDRALVSSYGESPLANNLW